jgi:8-oxo-dGTP pyrophosphatase MutT (NUDIX family)
VLPPSPQVFRQFAVRHDAHAWHRQLHGIARNLAECARCLPHPEVEQLGQGIQIQLIEFHAAAVKWSSTCLMLASVMGLHPHREPVATRPAATVLLLRDTPDNGGLEVLMTRRSGTASFAPGAYVFPGGGIDALDASPETHAAADRRPAQGDLHLTQAIAAIRESFEELGVLLARHTGGPRKGLMADAHDIAAIDRHQPFAAQCHRTRPAPGGRQRVPAGPLDG